MQVVFVNSRDMAITYGDGKAGQHAKRMASGYAAQILLPSMIAMFMAGAIIGLIAALFLQWKFGPFRWTGVQIWLLVIIEIGLLWVVCAGTRRVDRYTDKLARERIVWLRGGQAEALVAWHPQDLPNAWHVFHNVQLWKDGDLDHILIGPGGLFCISTKANRGCYTAGPNGGYLLNGENTDHVHEAQRLAMQLRDRLKGILGDVPWIQPVLIAPFAYIGFQSFQEPAWVLHEGNLPGVFENARGKLKTLDIERCAKAVKMIVENRK